MQARAGPRVGAGKALEWDTSLVVAVSPSEGGHGWMSTVLMGGGLQSWWPPDIQSLVEVERSGLAGGLGGVEENSGSRMTQAFLS